MTQVRNPTEIVQKNLFRVTFLFWVDFFGWIFLLWSQSATLKTLLNGEGPKGWFLKGWFWRMFPRNENRNEGMFGCSPGTKNRNEGTFGCSPGTKTGMRVLSPKPPFYETALSSPRDFWMGRDLNGGYVFYLWQANDAPMTQWALILTQHRKWFEGRHVCHLWRPSAHALTTQMSHTPRSVPPPR